MAVSFMKAISFLLVSLRLLFDWVRGSDFTIPEFYVDVVLVDLFERNNQRSILAVPPLRTSAKVVLLLVKLLS